TEFAQPLQESCRPLAIGRRRGPTQEPDDRHLRPLLGARRKRPCHRHPAQRGYEFSASDVGCHATLPWGSCPCNKGDDITPQAKDEQCFCTAKALSRPCLLWVLVV